jgi:hypothetical protein
MRVNAHDKVCVGDASETCEKQGGLMGGRSWG